jgi:hypothetical protein
MFVSIQNSKTIIKPIKDKYFQLKRSIVMENPKNIISGREEMGDVDNTKY